MGKTILSLIVLVGPGQDPPPAEKARAATPAQKAGRPEPKNQGRDQPPLCGEASRRPNPAQAQPMPQLFDRMMEKFTTDPANSFPTMLDELAKLETPALEGVALSKDEERRVGLDARSSYLEKARERGYLTVADPRKIGYLRSLVDRFSARMAHRDRYPNIEITLIDAPMADGQSFPGGFLVFTTGLLKEPDEATVAGVVAHELAHLDRAHVYNIARRTRLAEATFRNSPNFDQMFTRQAALLGLMMNPFRPEQETEADCVSTTWLYHEGYDPKALARFFERLHQRNRDQPDNSFFKFSKTHPYSLDRRRAVLDRLAQLKRWKNRDDLGLYPENLQKLEARQRVVENP